jgi:macrolide-specific efflux system membrane fusion protein
VKVGQPASVTLDALTGSSAVAGTVTAVSPVSTVVSNVVTYDDTVTLTAPPSDVESGMSATVAVTVASAANVLELPSSASHHGRPPVDGPARQEGQADLPDGDDGPGG